MKKDGNAVKQVEKILYCPEYLNIEDYVKTVANDSLKDDKKKNSRRRGSRK